MYWEEEFLYFLGYNDWLAQYRKNLRPEVRDAVFGAGRADFVSISFCWADTEEGFDFWCMVEEEWHRYLNYWGDEWK